MTGPSHYVWGVEPAIADLQEALGVNAGRSPLVISLEGVRSRRAFNVYSDKRTLSGSFERKRKLSAVRMRGYWNPLATSIAMVAIPNATSTKSHIDEVRQRAISKRRA